MDEIYQNLNLFNVSGFRNYKNYKNRCINGR